MATSRPSLDDFLNENWDAFRDARPAIDGYLRETARGMPAEFHRTLRKGLLESVLDTVVDDEARQPLKLRLVIDSGIIITEAFQVGRGRTSSTARLFDSPFVEAFAPPEAWEEVPRILREKCPADVKLEEALRHSEKILGKIRRIDEVSREALERARNLIGAHSPEDVSFLAVSFDLGADAVVSYDKRAYDRQSEMSRWTMRDGAEAILGYESGTLSISILGRGAEVLLRAAEALIAALVWTVAEVVRAASAIVNWIADKSSEAYERIPDWALWVAIAVAIGFIAAVALSEEFRDWVARGLSKATAILGAALSKLAAYLRSLWKLIKAALSWLWTAVLLPVGKFALVAGAVMVSHVDELIREIEASASSGA